MEARDFSISHQISANSRRMNPPGSGRARKRHPPKPRITRPGTRRPRNPPKKTLEISRSLPRKQRQSQAPRTDFGGAAPRDGGWKRTQTPRDFSREEGTTRPRSLGSGKSRRPLAKGKAKKPETKAKPAPNQGTSSGSGSRNRPRNASKASSTGETG